MAGAERAVAISDNVVLDFSGLFSAEPIEKAPSKSPVEPLLSGGQYKTLTEQEKPVEGLKTGLNGIPQKEPPEQAKILLLNTQREREDHQRSLEVYRTYQENIKTSGQLQTDILKGVQAGTDIYSLFLKAVKAISLMTSNTAFYSQIEADIKNIYGIGLQLPAPLTLELMDTQKRLDRLREAEQREPNIGSIKRAITAHQNRITELKKQIAKAQEKTQL